MTNPFAQAARELAARYADLTRRLAAAPDLAGPAGLIGLLQKLAVYRSKILVLRYFHQRGATILSGPFQGMEYLSHATEGCLLPRLLGGYESELHPHIEAFARSGPEVIIDIGCAEGYYAVGMARIVPGAEVYAHDIDEAARLSCAELAQKNGVADRITIGERFAGEDFAAFAGREVLVIMDAEGAEDELLDPAQWPTLKDMSLIVETHGMYRPGVTERLMERFAASHDIELIQNRPRVDIPPPWMGRMTQLDQLLCAWEWRNGPTPWLVMRPKG